MPAILMAKRRHNNVADSSEKWRVGQFTSAREESKEMGRAQRLEAGGFFHIYVTDKTVEELQEYLQEWKHDATLTQLHHNPVTHLRRIQVTSSMVSATGRHGFTRAQVEGFLGRWNGTYVNHNNSGFVFDAVIHPDQQEDIEMDINWTLAKSRYAQRRWALTPDAINWLENNGATISVTAQQLRSHIRDGLLD